MPQSKSRQHWLSRDAIDGWEHSSRLIGRALDWTTPNWITVAHIAATPVIFLCFAEWRTNQENDLWRFAGAAVYTGAVLSDWFDGALARYQKGKDNAPSLTDRQESALPLLQRLWLRGSTHTGARLDPIADKATFYCALLPLSAGYLPDWMIVANVALAIALTALRWPGVMRVLGLKDVRANRFGKHKMQVEIVAIASLALLVPWPAARHVSSVAWLAASTLLAALSLGGHFVKNWRKA